jgi:NAD(P)-dependent dehydrogenase (short-subunit alcohol dehydrogenase family)
MSTIFITGGARGIGLELTRLFLAAGDHVTVGVRDPDKAARAAPGAEPVTIDVLVNNAGIIGPEHQSTEEMDFAGFLDTLNVNTLGPLRVTQALLPNLRLSASPRVVIVSSRMGSLSYAKSDHVAYRASKAAVNKIAQALATDLAAGGIAVVSMHPGWVRTEMGGPGADISVGQSAAGIKAFVDGLTLARTGGFFNYDGGEMAW